MRLRLPSALFCAVLLCFGSLMVQGQSSTPISPISEPLWQALLPIAQTLPNSYDLFVSTMQKQVEGLTENNSSLSSSNLNLLTSNGSLTLENAALRASLKASQEAELTSENKSALLAKDLSDSTASTIRAQADAKGLELQVGIWKTAGIVAGVAAVDLGVKAFTGKDIIEWVVSLFKK